jgi:hypothetical protein
LRAFSRRSIWANLSIVIVQSNYDSPQQKSYSAKVGHPAIIFITFRAIRSKFNQGPTIRANIVIRPRRTSSHENRPC